MAMKILLLLMMVMALGHGGVQTCERRQDLIEMAKLRAGTRCNKSQESLVQLPVPAGYDYVRPSVAKVKQCTGLSCQDFPEKCVPDPQYSITRTFKVYAFRGDGHIRHCVTVQVEEHSACKCECEKIDCMRNRVFNENICECECISERQRACEERRKIGDKVMWSNQTCSCLCDNFDRCDSGTKWEDFSCSCVDKDELDSQEYRSNEI